MLIRIIIKLYRRTCTFCIPTSKIQLQRKRSSSLRVLRQTKVLNKYSSRPSPSKKLIWFHR